MDDLQRLIAIDEIGQVKARYCASIDDHDWPAHRGVFTDDAVFGDINGVKLDGPDNFVSWLSGLIDGVIITTHHVHNCQVDFISATEALVRWDLFGDIKHKGEGSAPFRHRTDWGAYHERYRKTAQGWRIADLRETLTHTMISSLGAGGGFVAPKPPSPSAPAQDHLPDLARLVATEEIRQLKARYCSAVDDRDWKGLRGVFSDDCTFAQMMGATFANADAFVAWVQNTNAGDVKTVHHVHNLEVEFLSPTAAKGRWRFEFWNWRGGELVNGGHGFGDYKEHYRKTDNGWRISGFGAKPAAPAAPVAEHRKGPLADLEWLLAIEDIKALKAHYCAAVDDRDWKRLRGVFANDATFGDMRDTGDNSTFANPDQFVAWLARVMSSDMASAHQVHNFQVAFTSSTEATARWDLVTPTWWVGKSQGPFKYRCEWGSYRDHYRKTADGWRIASFGGTLRHATEEQETGRTPPWTA